MFILLTSERNHDYVHGDDFTSDGLEHQLKRLEEVADEHFESKNTVKRAPSGLAKSLVMKNKNMAGHRNRVYPGQKTL